VRECGSAEVSPAGLLPGRVNPRLKSDQPRLALTRSANEASPARIGQSEARSTFNLPQGLLGEVGEFYEPGGGVPARVDGAEASVSGRARPERVKPPLGRR